MRLASLVLPFLVITALVSVAPAQGLNANVEERDGSSWINSTDCIDNNDSTAGNGPILGRGTGEGGAYYSFTYEDKQYRVLRSELTDEQAEEFEGLVGSSVEFTIGYGTMTDIHADT
ncbi:MAG: hypothetical protein ACYTGW_15900 [Planctomycetota bacterium]|jgi:hypothetical protein